MTIIHLVSQLVGHFCRKDTFGPDDFATIKVPVELEDRKAALVKLAADHLVEAKIVAPVGEGTWILTAPLPQHTVQIGLSLPVVSEIADVINTDLEARGIDDQVDPLDVNEGHIVEILNILNAVLAADAPPDQS